MKNLNYDILKLLHSKLDNVWRLENHYTQDAAGSDVAPLFENILADEREHADLLMAELKKRQGSGEFD